MPQLAEVLYNYGVRTHLVLSGTALLALAMALAGCSGTSSSVAARPSQPSTAPLGVAAPSVVPTFIPAGAADPSDGALRFVNSQTSRNAGDTCELVTDAFVQAAARIVGAAPGKTCVDILGQAYADRGTDQIDASELHPSVKSVAQSGSTAKVVVDYNLAPDSTATLEDTTVKLVWTGGHWLVTTDGS